MKTQRLSEILVITKRQRFVIGVFLLSILLFVSENLLGRSGFYVSIILSFLAASTFFLSVFNDIRGNRTLYIFILPIFVYTLAFGLFYFLLPARFLTRVILTTGYGVGLYSLFLSQNIFIVSILRTIPLLSGARISSFIVSFVSFFFLMAVLFSLRLGVLPTLFGVAVFSFLVVFQSIAVVYEKSISQSLLWTSILSLMLLQIATVLWFWPTTPTVVAIFLSGFFYTIVGLSHVWFDKRLFKGVIWEYVWVLVSVFLILIVFTNWRS